MSETVSNQQSELRWDATAGRWRNRFGRFVNPVSPPVSPVSPPIPNTTQHHPNTTQKTTQHHPNSSPLSPPRATEALWRMVYDLWNAKAKDYRQISRNATLITIALAVVWIRWGHPALTGAVNLAQATGDKVEGAVEAIAPDLGATPTAGEKIGPYTVSSAYGPRQSPCQGCSSNHKGVDIAAPVGSQQFIPDNSTVEVECFTYSYRGKVEQGAKFTTSYGLTVRSIHLSKCDGGKVNGGGVFALGGTSGTGPHWHVEAYRGGQIIPPPKELLWWMATGVQPKPYASRGGTTDAE